MNTEEEQLAALALSGVLTSVMFDAASKGRKELHLYEREGLLWLLRFIDRRSEGRLDNEWIKTFLSLNREEILDKFGLMNFNLREERMKMESTE